MSSADKKYNELMKQILSTGVWDHGQQVRPRWADGTPAYTKSIINAKITFLPNELPLLTQKEVKAKTATKEILWIWQKKSNVVQELRDMGVKIWDQWEQADGTIGKAYGYQLGKKCRMLQGEKVDQVDYLIYMLKNNPGSRRLITTLWDPDDLDEMSLEPCVWHTHWQVVEGQLHLTVGIRSNDAFIGNPFNMYQYHVIHRAIAQVTGHPLGTLTFNIDNLHIYDRHIKLVEQQITLPEYEQPELVVNPDVKNFYDFTPEDFQLIRYEHGPFIKAEVAE